MKDCYYRKAAIEALVQWHCVGREEACEIAQKGKIEQLERLLEIMGSLRAAAGGFMRAVEIAQGRKPSFLETPLELNGKEITVDMIIEDDGTVLETLGTAVRGNRGFDGHELSVEDLLFEIGRIVHQKWLEKTIAERHGTYADAIQFLSKRNSLHQLFPFDLLGWKEAEKDLLFVFPLFGLAGLDLNPLLVRNRYHGYSTYALARLENVSGCCFFGGRECHPRGNLVRSELAPPIAREIFLSRELASAVHDIPYSEGRLGALRESFLLSPDVHFALTGHLKSVADECGKDLRHGE